MLKSSRLLLAYLLVWFVVSGCATMSPDFKEPGVSLVSVKPRILNGVAPEFDILLRVTNPNRSELDIAGLSYNIYLVGNKVIEGVANDLPAIAAYGEAEVKLSATADLFGSLQVLTGLLADPTSPVEFEFNAEIDVGTFYPMINVNRTGVISLQ